jgi:aryl-alcohol dehydrogenase-like predicted oxidoreductase
MTYGSSKWREWVLDEEQSRPFIQRALEAGISFFDTTKMYSDGASEEYRPHGILGHSYRLLTAAASCFQE